MLKVTYVKLLILPLHRRQERRVVISTAGGDEGGVDAAAVDGVAMIKNVKSKEVIQTKVQVQASSWQQRKSVCWVVTRALEEKHRARCLQKLN